MSDVSTCGKWDVFPFNKTSDWFPFCSTYSLLPNNSTISFLYCSASQCKLQLVRSGYKLLKTAKFSQFRCIKTNFPSQISTRYSVLWCVNALGQQNHPPTANFTASSQFRTCDTQNLGRRVNIKLSGALSCSSKRRRLLQPRSAIMRCENFDGCDAVTGNRCDAMVCDVTWEIPTSIEKTICD